MADENRSFSPSKVAATRARMQGLGVGQTEMDLQQDPTRTREATARERTEPFDTELEAGAHGEDRPDAQFEAAEGGENAGSTTRAQPGPDVEPQPRADARMVGTPPNLDPHDFEDGDRPQLDWGEPEPEAQHGANHTRRPIKTEADRGQGPKTRRRNKEIVSGRPYG